MTINSRLTYIIRKMAADDVDGVTHMRLQSWRDTYVNEDIGVSRRWIEERNREQMTSERNTARKEQLKDPNVAGWVAVDSSGEIIGATTPYRDEQGVQHVGSLYVDKQRHGRGVGAALMQKVIDWAEPTRPIELGVVEYNERAKAFYRKWGFKQVPNSRTLFDDVIPEIKMLRKGDKS